MGYEYHPDDVDGTELEIAERINELLCNDFGYDGEQFTVTAEGDGQYTIDIPRLREDLE
jgi:hypothetical protein